MNEWLTESAFEQAAEKYRLTQREKEILNYWMRDYDYKRIADLLGISRHTVKVHISRINLKMQVNSKASLILKMIGA
ncbi:response regulator transcription factor [Cohnella thermotolerans]|jgi:DNA-binding CsgD family transcriptional regulator|uniref:response regulator transcription factor n=1 Tax=Cohnella thermotolerans TaxID=329858 RepID=UPI0004224A5A|nr:helix-turn-helix transcriptional regulator [Cohnella thermotolerans]